MDPNSSEEVWVNLPLVRFLLKVYCGFAQSRIPHLNVYGSEYVQLERYHFATYFPDSRGRNWSFYEFKELYPRMRMKFDETMDIEKIKALLKNTDLRR